jgi:hypothetical protein
MELQSLFGLPAHPLVVHAAVVLLPLAALGTLITACVPRLRQHYALLAFAIALVATGAVAAAQGSGESLKERVTETQLVEDHAEQGSTVLPWAIGVTVVAAGVAAAGELHRRRPELSASRVTAVLVVAALVTCVGATWTVIDVGHSGAKATWDKLPPEGQGGG